MNKSQTVVAVAVCLVVCVFLFAFYKDGYDRGFHDGFGRDAGTGLDSGLLTDESLHRFQVIGDAEPKRTLSVATRQSIAKATKARWAAKRKGLEVVKKAA